jgi:hypothetical protein
MSERVESNKSLIEPIYPQAAPNECIELGNVVLQFTHKNKTYQRTAKALIRFLPRERFLFVVPAEDIANDPLWALRIGHSLIEEEHIELKLVDKGVSVEVYCAGAGLGADELVFEPKEPILTVTSQPNSLCSVVFHLFNFPDFAGPDDYTLIFGERPPGGFKRCGRAVLKAGGWSITIAATEKTDSLVKSLQQQGGFIVTHMGKITREDGSVFSAEQVEQLLPCVQRFLSFALDRWVGVALSVGFDANGQRIFDQWNLPLVTAGSWNGSCSWFDPRHGACFLRYFPDSSSCGVAISGKNISGLLSIGISQPMNAAPASVSMLELS